MATDFGLWEMMRLGILEQVHNTSCFVSIGCNRIGEFRVALQERSEAVNFDVYACFSFTVS